MSRLHHSLATAPMTNPATVSRLNLVSECPPQSDSTHPAKSPIFRDLRHSGNNLTRIFDPSGTLIRHSRNACIDTPGTHPRHSGNGLFPRLIGKPPNSEPKRSRNLVTESLNSFLTFLKSLLRSDYGKGHGLHGSAYFVPMHQAAPPSPADFGHMLR